MENEVLKRTHTFYLPDQCMTLKMICINHNAEVPFEDHLQGSFSRYISKKDICLRLESSIRRGPHLFHNGSEGIFGRSDL